MTRRDRTVHECWRVVVRHERRSGALGFFRSDLMSYTAARAAVASHLGMGRRAYLECDEDAVASHRHAILRAKAIAAGRDLGPR
jgi:hypothetical protein